MGEVQQTFDQEMICYSVPVNQSSLILGIPEKMLHMSEELGQGLSVECSKW